MRKSILTVSFVTLLLFATIGAASFYAVKSFRVSTQERRSHGVLVSGSVVDPDGRQVPGADVFAQSTGPSRGIRPHTVTDAEGNFSFTGLRPGSYFLETQKESEGYASTLATFNSAGLVEAPQIVVTENQVLNGIMLRLGPKSARLTGSIIDAKTKKPIKDCDIILRRSDNPKYFYSIGPNDSEVWNKFAVLVPPLPFTIEVNASGYERWTYSNDGTGRQMSALRMASGERRDLIIALRPKEPNRSRQ